jgi:carboxylesterase
MKLIGEMKRILPEIACPLLVFYSRGDPTIHPQSVQLVYDRVRSTDKAIVALQASGHVITIDREWQQVAEESYRFIQQRS